MAIRAAAAGRPDFTGKTHELSKGVVVSGYKAEVSENETINYLAYIALSDTPGALNFTQGGIAPGTEVNLFDISTGNQYFITEEGYDAIVKDMWVSFTQPVRWRMYSYYHSDYCCQAFFEPFAKPLNVYPFGYQKSSLLPLASEWKLEARVKNLGTKTMYGKAWATILKKEGSYSWR